MVQATPGSILGVLSAALAQHILVHPPPAPLSGCRLTPTHTPKATKCTLRAPAMSYFPSWETPHSMHQNQALAHGHDPQGLKEKVRIK